ncbi:hypothetical protein ACFL6H_00325 [Candidatus Latescibacterota bacterium]
MLAALMCISALCESLLYLPSAVKKILFFFSLIIPALLFISLFVRSFIRRPGPDEISRFIEHTYPFLNNSLISAVQLGRLSERELRGQSGEIIDALIEKVDNVTATLDFSKSVPADRLKLSLKIAAGTIFVVLLTSILLPGNMMGGFLRLADYTRTYIPPERIKIYTTQENDSIIRGENFEVSGFVSGDKSEELRIFFRWDDSGIWNMKPVGLDELKGDFTAVIEKPRLSFQYYLEANDIQTPKNNVTVIERPDIESFEITLTYPEYTGVGTFTPENNDGNIRVLSGTDVTIKLTANKPLKEMSIVWSDTTEIACTVAGSLGTAAFTAEKTIDYRFDLVDSLGISNNNPITYRLTCFEDEFPTVSIISPVVDVVLRGALKLPVIYTAGDDYGITSISLTYKLPYEDESRIIPLMTMQDIVTDIEGEYEWSLSGLNLLPGDVIPFNLVVYDNDSAAGPKESISETINVRLPSITDIMRESVEEQNTDIYKLREISDNAAEQEKKLDSVNKNIKSNNELDWSDKTTIEETKQNLENMQKEIKDISEDVKKIADKLTEENLAAVETLDKLREISEIMKEISEGEIKEALKQLTQANIEIDPRKIKEALDRYKITSEDLKKKLDKIINFLEQVKSLQRFEMAGNLLEDMASKQAEMAQKYNIDPHNPAYPREEEILAKEMEKIQKELIGAADNLKEIFKLNTMEFEESIAQNDVAEIKQKASQEMSDGLTENAEQSLNKSNSMISELLDKYDTLNASMQAANSEEMKKRLFKSLNEMLIVSQKQERFLNDAKSSENEKSAQIQLEIIDAVSKAEQSLMEFGQVFIEISGIIDQMMTSTNMTMRNAVDSYAAGNPADGEKNARDALKMVNSSIHFLTLLLQQEQSAEAGMSMPGDLMQKLQDIANGQLSLNSQISSELMEKLAAEQYRLSEMLSELSEQIAGDRNLRELLQKLSEEMDETGDMMRKNEQRELIERKQLDIYRRILDARRSRREKDEADERKSMTAKTDVSIGADSLPLDLGERKLELNRRIKEALNDDFDPEYMRLIRNYFESLLGDDFGGEQ